MIVELETEFYQEEEILRSYLDGMKSDRETVLSAMDRIFQSNQRSLLFLSVASVLFWDQPCLKERWNVPTERFNQEAQEIFLTVTNQRAVEDYRKQDPNIKLVKKTLAENVLLKKIKTEKTGQKNQIEKIRKVELLEKQKKALLFLCSCNENKQEPQLFLVPYLLGLLRDKAKIRNRSLSYLFKIIQKTTACKLKQRNIHNVVFEYLKEAFLIHRDELSLSCLTELIVKTENKFSRTFFLKADSILEAILDHDLLCFIPKLALLLEESFIRFLDRTMELIRKHKKKGKKIEKPLKEISKVCWIRIALNKKLETEIKGLLDCS